MTVLEALKEGEHVLQEANISSSSADCKILLENRLGVNRASLICMYNDSVGIKVYEEYMKDITKRSKHMPVAYITGTKEFMNLKFNVNENVLIPRGDTEILVLEAIKAYKENKSKNHTENNKEKKYNDEKKEESNIIDMCTGSGCIAISIAKEFTGTNVYAVDFSKKALEVATSNIKLNDTPNVRAVHSDLFETLKSDKYKDELENNVDMIVSNPPYIKTEIVKTLDTDVKDYEPNMALDGGDDGLIFYINIMKQAKTFLKDNGILAFEIDCTYYKELKKLLEDENYYDVKLYKDYADLDRVIIARLNKRLNKL